MAGGPSFRVLVSLRARRDSLGAALRFCRSARLRSSRRGASATARDCPVVQPAGRAAPRRSRTSATCPTMRWKEREVGSRGEGCSAAYLAQRFAELGLVPAGANGSWFQTFPVRGGSVLAGPGALEISGALSRDGQGVAALRILGLGRCARSHGLHRPRRCPCPAFPKTATRTST